MHGEVRGAAVIHGSARRNQTFHCSVRSAYLIFIVEILYDRLYYMIGELFAGWCDLWTIISESGTKRLCAAKQKPGCGATVCVQRKSLCVHFDVRKSASNVLLLYEKRPSHVWILPDSRHVVFYNTLSVIKIKCWFSGKKRTVVPDPLPLAYAVYAFINVDNCERPLKKSKKIWLVSFV